MESLTIRLAGPMQSWGSHSRWDYRDTEPIPTKSGIVGLLSCAIGYDLNDPHVSELITALSDAITIDIVTNKSGIILTDFQTITTIGGSPTADSIFKSDGSFTDHVKCINGQSTIVSLRDYLYDADFTVIIHGSMKIVDQCRNALLSPHWSLYLGRKCCIPSIPIYDPSYDINLSDDLNTNGEVTVS